MKFSKFGRATLAAVLSLGVAATLTACGPSNFNTTVDYVYVTNSKANPGQIDVYDLHGNSGQLTQIPDSPYPSGGRNPVGLVTSPDGKYLYVINHDDNTIVEFGIGTDAKLYPQHTYNTPGTFPNAIAIDITGTFLFVTDTYQPQYTAANPGPGALVVYPITSTDGSLGTPVANGNLSYYPLSLGETDVLNPTAVNTLITPGPNPTTAGGPVVYVVSQDSTTGLGDISAFSVAPSGALTAVPCAAPSVCNANGTFSAGSTPSAITSTPVGRYLFVTDSARNQLLSYAVQTDGQIVPLPNSPISTDVFPDGVTVDPTGTFVYVSNYTANNISAYFIGASTPTTGIAPNGSYGTGSGPTCVFVEPALGIYVYTTNFLDNTVSGLNINSYGILAPVQNTPFLAAGQPTCIAATVHGKHPGITPTN